MILEYHRSVDLNTDNTHQFTLTLAAHRITTVSVPTTSATQPATWYLSFFVKVNYSDESEEWRISSLPA